jgi:photosystem II stability/assembly factor-like uncharacterized protein
MRPSQRAVASLSLLLLSGAGAQTRQPLVDSSPSTSASPWELQNSTTKAGLRGIHAVGNGVAWASGTNGTILRTEDGGYMWQSCAMPPGAEKLDFRGIWAWDANTAVAMSSGPGDQSRIYKTTDGCSSWKLLYTNPDKDGFWDAIAFADRENGLILGDPVGGRFSLLFTLDAGNSWAPVVSKDLDTGKSKLGAFAASNSSIQYWAPGLPWFGSSGPDGPYVYMGNSTCTNFETADVCWKKGMHFERQRLPMAGGSASAGVFSLGLSSSLVVAVGGDYLKPNEFNGTAAYTLDLGKTWFAPTKPPHGYRSAVAWDAADNAWITVGTNGSDVSWDRGKTWKTLDNGNWNALSLPWVVGPEGRIAKLVSLSSAGKSPVTPAK